MRINNNYIELYKDNYNIYNLITKIDKNYRLVFNKKKKIFQIINIAKNNQICLNFNNFSLNIVKILQESRVENSNKIFKNLDDFNKNLEVKIKCDARFKLQDRLKNLVDYSKRTNQISNSDINKIIEGKHA